MKTIKVMKLTFGSQEEKDTFLEKKKVAREHLTEVIEKAEAAEIVAE